MLRTLVSPIACMGSNIRPVCLTCLGGIPRLSFRRPIRMCLQRTKFKPVHTDIWVRSNSEQSLPNPPGDQRRFQLRPISQKQNVKDLYTKPNSNPKGSKSHMDLKHNTSDFSYTSEDVSPRIPAHPTSLRLCSLKRVGKSYLSLSKPRLTFLMVLTTASAYSLYPMPSILLPSATESPSLSALTLLYLTLGTGLCSASANSLNMAMEPEYDSKMSRTRNRPLVRGIISRRGALVFAFVTATLGVAGLYVGVNPTVSALGGLNIFLYAGVYTPLKRLSVLNTWVGAVVGAIPPLMGWAAGAGQSATGTGDWKELLFGTSSSGGWLLATLLFAWQFHHFNALSWTVRHEYKQAGYRMLAWVNESMNSRIALRYALLCFPTCWGLSVVGVTDWGFLATSSAVNAWIARAAWSFYRLGGHKGSARGLFWAGVWQLPTLLVLAMAHKKGLWEGVWARINGVEGSADQKALIS